MYVNLRELRGRYQIHSMIPGTRWLRTNRRNGVSVDYPYTHATRATRTSKNLFNSSSKVLASEHAIETECGVL